METNNLILIEQLCIHHNIEFSFINALQEFGLIEVIIIEDNKYIANEKIKDVEKMMRLHFELDINIEGIDAISNLLQQIDNLQKELISTKNKLRLYEGD
jgi:cell division FtsZ-interacting protein ZapD